MNLHHSPPLLSSRPKMLDFFSIFSRGGILLWCFRGAGLLQEEWEAFRPAVNQFVKQVLLQVGAGQASCKCRALTSVSLRRR